eukprot:gnl/MRDRNA2_/MRDRNA2_29615_c0_seq1.p1 gnl/MRDRNA2_/MRDRNA2_29615_c0~~gnl/MRDRNA2_/MRDRNA2_29615_c0_seq1.p1  ORF type:complete len:244 (+),score=34.43 gnl/MRDRNA2_/MRDRNA2_29615_c0_seq1:65-796(+)
MTAVDRQSSLPAPARQFRQRRSATGPCRALSLTDKRRSLESRAVSGLSPVRPDSKASNSPYLERSDSQLDDNPRCAKAPDSSLKPGMDRPTAVLFLDVDGVLHPGQVRHERQQFQRQCMELLRDVIAKTNAVIVLSTAWRLAPEPRQIVAEKLKAYGLPGFVSRTPNIQQFQRAREILAWVKKFKPMTWVAVDDWPLLMETSDIEGHFVQSRPRYGLQRDTADQIITLFKRQQEQLRSDQEQP